LFHFITPSGHEDAWAFYVRWRLSGKPSEILINHVNYFEGGGLERHLNDVGFHLVEYYTDNVKGTREGRGWRIRERNAAPISSKRSAKAIIDEKGRYLVGIGIDKTKVLNQWWLKPRRKWTASWYCRYKDWSFIRLSPQRGIGHELIGLAQKR
jgi:hypothetical protein